jgi:hypothetical protein
MLVPQVSAELMIITQAVANKPGHADIINTMLKEHTMFGFDAVYAATQRLYAFAHALANTDAFDCWISPPGPGEIYSEINPAVWEAVATAPLERLEEDLYTQARFDAEEIRRSVRLAS